MIPSHNYKKIIAIVFLVLVLFSVAPKISKAAVPVFETNTVLVGKQTLQQTLTAIATGKSIVQDLFEWAFKLAVETLRRQLLNMIVDQIVTWIQGGGNPKFITDWPGFFRDAVDQAGGKFLQQVGLGQLCSAFGFKLSAAFIPIPQFSTRSACTLSQVGANLDAFLKDFRQGGWIAWDEMVLRPQNNIYGAYIMAWDQYEIEKSAALKAAEAEAQAGKGFLSVRRCVAWNNEGYQMCVASGLLESECKKASCIKEEVVTPGHVVGELAAQALGSDIPYIISAQELETFVAAIANAVLNRMFAEGVGLLRMGFSGGGGDGGGTVSSATMSATRCSSMVGTAAYTACVSAVQSGTDVREFQKNYLVSIIEQELSVQNQLLGAKQATLLVLNQSLTVLNSANCAGLGSSIVGVQNMIRSVSDDIAKIQSDIIALQGKREEIRAATDPQMIVQLWSQIIYVVNPATTQSLLFASQQETSQKQQQHSSYQQQIDACLLQQQQTQ